MVNEVLVIIGVHFMHKYRFLSYSTQQAVFPHLVKQCIALRFFTILNLCLALTIYRLIIGGVHYRKLENVPKNTKYQKNCIFFSFQKLVAPPPRS